MITNEGVVKLADFGIARAVNDATLSTGSKIVGSVHYFSPEQARGNYVDERSDIYSLGIVMYEMLTGRVPFDGDNPVTVALKHINEEIVPPSELVDGIPPNLERCVMKATNKYQTNRYSNADELIEDLNNISFVANIAGDSIFESSSVLEKRIKDRKAAVREEEDDDKDDRKKGKGVKIAVLIILLLLVIGGFTAWFIAWRNGVFSSTKPAPDFLGKSIEDAQRIAEEEGFTIKQGKDIYSNDYPESKVCNQDPQPGVETPKEGTITVNLSKGSKEGMVPNIVGMNKDDVEAFLAEYGYTVGNVKTVTEPDEEGTILEQDPVAGTKLDKESRINITVSDGKGIEKGTVPSVTGLSPKKAKKAIQEAGFEVGRIDYDWSNSIDKGYVMYQQYQANSLLDKGTSIDISVSKGPEPEPEPPEPEETEDDSSGETETVTEEETEG
jgi:serine/threonine-protein kinase